jgi:heat shock protein HslJ
MKVLRVIAVMVALGGAGCDESPVSPSELTNITWKLESIERTGSAPVAIPNPEEYTLRLEDNGRANVRADCNSCNGRYSLDGSSLSITAVACTRAFCGLGSFDGNYADALENVRSAAVSGNQLTIRGNGFTLRFRS